MITRILTATMIMVMLTFAPLMFGQHEEQGSHAKVDAKAETQTACPLSGKPIDKEISASHDGKLVYFCCADCKTAFEKDPEKIISKLEAEGVQLEMVHAKQTLCPLMGGKIDKLLYSVQDGKKVYFCCPMCKPKFEKDPAKYIEEMEAKGIELEKVNKSE